MDKSALLVLLCLQAFLLITAFTSADAATLVMDPQPPDLVERRNDHNKKVFGNRRKRYSNCMWNPGACGVMGERGSPGIPAPPPPPPPPPTPPTHRDINRNKGGCGVGFPGIPDYHGAPQW